MRRLIFVVAFMAWAVWSALSPDSTQAQTLHGAAIFELEPGRGTADGGFNVLTDATNFPGTSAARWTLWVLGDTVRVTFGQNVADTLFYFTMWFPPGLTLSSEIVGNPRIDTLYVNATGTFGAIAFWGFCHGN